MTRMKRLMKRTSRHPSLVATDPFSIYVHSLRRSSSTPQRMFIVA